MVTHRARALCLWALCLAGLMATVQTGHCEVSATLTGIVVDGRGHPVAGAHVTLVSDGTRTTHVLTGPDGVYRFPALQPGPTYSVTVGHAGYRSVEYEGMRLEAGTTRTLDVRLKVPGEREIVALLSRDPFPYRNLLEAVLRHLDIPARVYDLDQDPEPEETVRRVRAERPDLILGAGLRAARLIRREIRDIPSILTLISDPRRHDLEEANICFVSSNPDPEELPRRILDFLPGARRLGLVYAAHSSSLLARDLRIAARRAGLRVELRPVYHPENLQDVLDDLRERIDVLAVPYDPLTSTPETTGLVTRWALRNRVPLAAADPAWVRRGALFSYGPSPQTVGQEVAWMASQILFHGRQPGEFALRVPRSGAPALNEVTALALGVTIPAGLEVELAR